MLILRILIISACIAGVFALANIINMVFGSEIVVEEEIIIEEDEEDEDDNTQSESKKSK